MVENIIFIIIGFILGFYRDHFRDIAKCILKGPRYWGEVVKGMWNSKKANLLFIFVISGLLIGASFYDRAEDTRMLQSIEQSIVKANQPLVDEIHALIIEIRQERN